MPLIIYKLCRLLYSTQVFETCGQPFILIKVVYEQLKKEYVNIAFCQIVLQDLVTNISILCTISPTHNWHSWSQSFSILFTISCLIFAFQCNILTLLLLDFLILESICFLLWKMRNSSSTLIPTPMLTLSVLLYCSVLLIHVCFHDFDYCLQLSHMYILW